MRKACVNFSQRVGREVASYVIDIYHLVFWNRKKSVTNFRNLLC